MRHRHLFASLGAAGLSFLAAAALAEAPASPTPAPQPAAAPQVGQPAPDFTLSGEDGKSYRLRDQRGRWIVLAFYPADYTRG